MMKEVIFLIGLPGCGKSTLIKYYHDHPFLDYKDFDDWDTSNGFNKGHYYPDLVESIKKGDNVIVACIDFCYEEILRDATNYLKSDIDDDLKIVRIYFENDLELSIKNITKRDIDKGGYWEIDEKTGENWYYGTIYEEKPLYKLEIEKTKVISKEYKVPLNYNALSINKKLIPVKVQKD